MQPTAADIRLCALVALRNNVLTFVFAAALVTRAAKQPDRKRLLRLRVDASPPPAGEVLRHVLLSFAMREVMVYYVHRWLHTPRLYRAIHKTHHKFVVSVALASQYAHPLEHLFANVLLVALPPLILHAHVLTNWVFTFFTLVETATVHSGYDFFGGVARMHDAHHEKFTINYGVFGLMDWVHGTNGRRGVRKQAE